MALTLGDNTMSLLLMCLIFFSGSEAKMLSYDYSASIQCSANPQRAQYGGGIIKNPELNDGLQGWTAFGDARIEQGESRGNEYIIAHSRNQPHDSVSQKIYLQKNKLYSFSAWIQVSKGKVPVTAVFKTIKGFKHAGAIVAESSCWSMLKGGLTADASGPAQVYFESNITSVEIWVDSISLQPFTPQEWRSHQDQSIEKARKRKVSVQAVDEQGNPLPNASISVKQIGGRFPFGNVINSNIINNTAYQNWFASRFTVTVFQNEMKWYSTESTRGKEDYSVADSMVQFAKKHGIALRGHNVFWDDPQYQPSWVPSLSPDQLDSAVQKRMNSVVSRYKGQLIAWDVVNENLHFSFFESKLGQNASAKIYNAVHKIDGQTTLFLNDYNTIEDSRDTSSTPAKYIEKLREIQSFSGNNGMQIGIGLESHYSIPPNLPYMRASIDTLAATGSPIWLTEVDVKRLPKQADYLEQILREAHSHPKVQGIVLWAAWDAQGCTDGSYTMCLTDKNFRNLPTGNVVDKLLKEWGFKRLEGTTDQNGIFEASLFHGDYQVAISHPVIQNFTLDHHLQVTPTDESKQTKIIVQVSL